MVYQQLKEKLRGVAFTIATPFGEDRSNVLYNEIAKNVQHIQTAGGEVFIPCGNTGEYYSLSPEERVKVVETTVEAATDDATVVGGVGGSTKEVLSLAEAYADVGADGIMIMNPDHTFIHERGLIEYYETIAAETDLGVVLYKRGPEVPMEAISALAERDNIVSVKYAVNDINAFSRAVDEVSGDVVWSAGIAERFVPSFALEGAEGFTTGIGAFAPEASLALMDAIRSEDWERAKQLRDVIRPYEQLREEPGPNNKFEAANNVPAIKYGLELAGLYGGSVREPLVELSEEDKQRAKTHYQSIQQTVDEPNQLMN